ncbi:MAG: hypothetical protein QOE82_2148 [Thermoanaerobaculia bacterium]|jgi:hypothetical protein|nr:hypothetical protein [Thermoanaerobaculia bacterium]
MPHYAPDAVIRDARERYFAIAGFDNGGYEDKWVRLKAGPLTVKFPNTAARVRSVKLHDIHHILTEYDTSWIGEAEIGAWEIASGCGRHAVAWTLNLGAFGIGLVIAPRRTYRAFVRGRHSRNLYPTVFREELLDERVGSMRDELSIQSELPRVSTADRMMFAIWSSMALIYSIAPTVTVVAAAFLLLRAFHVV